MTKLVARLLATAAVWARVKTSLKNTKWAASAKKWPTQSSPPKNIQKNRFGTVSRRTPVGVVDFGGRETPNYKANSNYDFQP
jgi:hypothetical protein